MVPVKTNSNWLPSIFNDFFENEWLAKTGVTAPAINVILNDIDDAHAPGCRCRRGDLGTSEFWFTSPPQL